MFAKSQSGLPVDLAQSIATFSITLLKTICDLHFYEAPSSNALHLKRFYITFWFALVVQLPENGIMGMKLS